MSDDDRGAQTPQDWTKEPWSIDATERTLLIGADIDGRFYEVAAVGGDLDDDVSDSEVANANRIVLCVNALAGVPNESLLARPTVSQAKDRIAELIAAAEEVALLLRYVAAGREVQPSSATLRVERLRAAIAGMGEVSNG